jgi:PadR family transcriptional regulator, regulatory protein AphA
MATATRTRLSTTELAILGLLSYGEHSGYELKKVAEASVGYLWSPAKSHIYAVLPRLVTAGLATAREVPQRTRPDKRIYRITAQGRRVFRDWLEDPGAGPPNTFLLKLFFGRKTSTETVVARIERRRAEVEAELAEYRSIEDLVRDDESSYFGYVTLRWGIAQAEAWLRWADEILAELALR